MVDHLTEQKLLEILQEVRALADHNENITSQELVKQIEMMLLNKNDPNETNYMNAKQLVLNT